MSLDVEVPDPPALRGPQSRGEYDAIDMTDERPEDDYRRGEVENFLREGAWQDAFEAWAEATFMSEAEFEAVLRLGLLQGYDFFWDPATGDVGYRAPRVPDDAREQLGEGDAEGVDEELDSLGRIVTEVLENDYLLREDETFGFFEEEYKGEPYDEEEALREE